MKIGVGVITTGERPLKLQRVALWADLQVVTDVDRRGPSWGRNECLKRLQGCDHIFLMDDDCYPVMPGWEAYLIEQFVKHGVDYSVLPEAFKTPLLGTHGEMGYWAGGIGAFCYQSAKALDVVGGYNEAYDRYGFEDAGRLNRAQRAGLTGPNAPVSCPIRALAYIHSEDVFAENPTPTVSRAEKQRLIDKNRPLYDEELAGPLYYGL